MSGTAEKCPTGQEGFSLIELVIVITIMAVLVGIVGIQIFPYIEKSKRAKDIQLVSSYCTGAAEAYIASTDALIQSETYTILVNNTDAGWVVHAQDSTGAENLVLETDFYDASGINAKNPVFQSKEGKRIKKITIICKNSKPMVELQVEGPEDASAFEVIAQ